MARTLTTLLTPLSTLFLDRNNEDDDAGEESLEKNLGRAAARLEGGGGSGDEDADEDDSADDDAGDDESDDAGDDEDADDTDDDAADDDEDDSDDADEDDDGDDADDDEDGDGAGDEDDEDDEGKEEELDPEVAAAAARHQLPTTFEDIVRKLPKNVRAEARVAFQKRLKDVESGLGRAFQEARAERKELTRLKAERKHEEEHRADVIADLIDANPKLLEELNQELEKRETGAYRDAKKMQREQAKKELDQSVDQDEQVREQRRQRGQTVASLAQKLARDAGVPFKVIDKAIYAAVIASPTRDITDAEIARLVKQEAKDWRNLTGERKREKKAEYIRDKEKKAKDAKRRVTPRDRGHAPAPGRRREPKSLEEALTRRAASILPDAPA